MTAVPEEDSAEPVRPYSLAQTGVEPRWARVQSVSIVIPALNEEENLPWVMATIPREELAAAGCSLEVVVIDNASSDRTAEVAAELGATVHSQPLRGYGNAYRAGFAAASGDVIATGDADCTYPFDALPGLIDHLHGGGYDFLSTYRLGSENRDAMKFSHAVGNRVLSTMSRSLFGAPFRDSQSGMWIFKRTVWPHLDVRSGGMPFSQEIKNEAYLKGFRCDEVPIEYRQRGGVVKLRAFRDGMRNLSQLAAHRGRAERLQPDMPTGADEVTSSAATVPGVPRMTFRNG